jgi:hypothetical protein
MLAVIKRRAQIFDRSRIVVRVAGNDPSKKNDARGPLMWNAAHSCALR